MGMPATRAHLSDDDIHHSVIQATLHHSSQRTIARYIHPDTSNQLEAQELCLDAINIRGERKKLRASGELGLNLGLAKEEENL